MGATVFVVLFFLLLLGLLLVGGPARTSTSSATMGGQFGSYPSLARCGRETGTPDRSESVKIRCLLVRHRWRQYSNDDGERYERCERCGQYNFPMPPGGKNAAAL